MDGTAHAILYGIIAVFVAGIIKGLTGFGFSLAVVPVLVLLLGPRTAIPIVIILNALTNIGLYFSVRKWVDLKRIRPLIISGIVSIPIGMVLLLVLNVTALKIIIGCTICIFALAFLLGFRKQVHNEKRGFMAAGLVSGTLNGAISTGGPPVILFLTHQGDAKRPFRANLIAYFLFPVGSSVELNSREKAEVIEENRANPMRPVVKITHDKDDRSYEKPRIVNLDRDQKFFITRSL